ncbi:Striatin Pro11 [Lachnellula suecica]|uniref:Striatin Pro11 n=1 Tax=Lachnellula suecica TaxID=602035 RepID=A0A8T9BWF7_9HELO|nr:Striatin Pro11 [Lachnellula suecica]
MAWQSLSGMGGSGGGNGGGNGGQEGNGQQQGNQPQGTEYTLQGVMRFLQTEWHRHERDRNAWEIERQEMKGRIARLEGSTRKSDSSNKALKKYVNMLEKALKERDSQVKALKAGKEVDIESIRDEKERESVKFKMNRVRPNNGLASQDKPHNSFLEVEEDVEADRAEEDPDRGSLKGFMDKTQGELTYLMVSPSNPLPPRDPPPPEEALLPPSFGPGPGQQSLEEIYQQQPRQKNMRESNMSRPSPTPNHHPPPVPASSSLAVRNAEVPMSRSLADQQPLPQPTQQEWSTAFQMPEPPEEEVTKINHTFDSYGRAVDSEPVTEKEPTTEADGWDFNEAAQFPEPEIKVTTPHRPDQDLFPIAQDPPKSPNRGPGSHRRKTSISRRKSGEHDLSLNQASKVDGSSFKVRFGLRGHLDAVRSVIFTGGGSPGEPEICTAGDDGTIKRWIIPARYDSQAGMHNAPNDLDIQSYFTHRGHTGTVMCLTAWSPSQNFSSGGRAQGDGWTFSGGQDATIRVWERGRVDPKATLDGHTDAVWTVCVLPGTTGAVFGQNNAYGGPDRILLASGAADGTVKVWSISSPPQLISPQGGSTGRRGGRVRGNSMSSGSAFPSSPQPSVASNSPFHYTLIHSISRANSTASPTCITPLSASGDAFVVSYSDAAVLVYDTRTGEEVASMASLETYNGTESTGVNAIVATTNGLDGSLSFDSGRGLSEDEGVVGGATGSSGGVEGIVISGHEDRFIRFYDANSGKHQILADKNHSTDGVSGQCTYNMLAHPAAISALSLSPDGRELVSAGHDASLRFWSLEKRSCTQEITSHRLMRGEGVCSVVWSQDGRWVVSAGGDGVVKVFAR